MSLARVPKAVMSLFPDPVYASEVKALKDMLIRSLVYDGVDASLIRLDAHLKRMDSMVFKQHKEQIHWVTRSLYGGVQREHEAEYIVDQRSDADISQHSTRTDIRVPS